MLVKSAYRYNVTCTLYISLLYTNAVLRASLYTISCSLGMWLMSLASQYLLLVLYNVQV